MGAYGATREPSETNSTLTVKHQTPHLLQPSCQYSATLSGGGGWPLLNSSPFLFGPVTDGQLDLWYPSSRRECESVCSGPEIMVFTSSNIQCMHCPAGKLQCTVLLRPALHWTGVELNGKGFSVPDQLLCHSLHCSFQFHILPSIFYLITPLHFVFCDLYCIWTSLLFVFCVLRLVFYTALCSSKSCPGLSHTSSLLHLHLHLHSQFSQPHHTHNFTRFSRNILFRHSYFWDHILTPTFLGSHPHSYNISFFLFLSRG